jgi:deoxyhypusine synthase
LSIQIYAEASLVFPLLVGETFARDFHNSKSQEGKSSD